MIVYSSIAEIFLGGELVVNREDDDGSRWINPEEKHDVDQLVVSGHRKSGVGNTSPSHRKSVSASRSMGLTGEQTVKRLRLSKASTEPDTTSTNEACRRMAARRVESLLLTDSNALLCGILTAKDIATRVIAREVNSYDKEPSNLCFLAPLL